MSALFPTWDSIMRAIEERLEYRNGHAVWCGSLKGGTTPYLTISKRVIYVRPWLYQDANNTPNTPDVYPVCGEAACVHPAHMARGYRKAHVND